MFHEEVFSNYTTSTNNMGIHSYLNYYCISFQFYKAKYDYYICQHEMQQQFVYESCGCDLPVDRSYISERILHKKNKPLIMCSLDTVINCVKPAIAVNKTLLRKLIILKL